MQTPRKIKFLLGYSAVAVVHHINKTYTEALRSLEQSREYNKPRELTYEHERRVVESEVRDMGHVASAVVWPISLYFAGIEKMAMFAWWDRDSTYDRDSY